MIDTDSHLAPIDPAAEYAREFGPRLNALARPRSRLFRAGAARILRRPILIRVSPNGGSTRSWFR